MDLPQRSLTHIIEKDAINILISKLPKTWVVREMTERDYGIDLYIEITSNSNHITGDMIALQVKGKEKIHIRFDEFTFYGIKSSSLNYWLGLPIPVFFVVVDIDSNNLYWINVKDENRKGGFKRSKEGNYNIKINTKGNFPELGSNYIKFLYIKEKRWKDVENAIENSLMSFTSFGPFILMCKRKPDNEFCSTTVQYLLLRYYEYYELLSRYILNKKPKSIIEWYKEEENEMKNNPYQSLTFNYKTIKEIIKHFAGDYRECIRISNLLVIKHYNLYYQDRFPLLYMHLKSRPLTFCESDWYARYYYDEYENETINIEKKFFDDFSEYDDFDLINDLNI